MEVDQEKDQNQDQEMVRVYEEEKACYKSVDIIELVASS